MSTSTDIIEKDMMSDSSDEEVARLSNYFDNDDQEKKQIVRQNTLKMWRSKAGIGLLPEFKNGDSRHQQCRDFRYENRLNS